MKPYWTQARKEGTTAAWITDTQHDHLQDAIAAGVKLRDGFRRRVQVIDSQSGRILWRCNPEKGKS